MLRNETQTTTAAWLLITLLMTAAAITHAGTLGGTIGGARGSSTAPRLADVVQRTAPARAPSGTRPGIARGERAPKEGLFLLMLLAEGTRSTLSR